MSWKHIEEICLKGQFTPKCLKISFLCCIEENKKMMGPFKAFEPDCTFIYVVFTMFYRDGCKIIFFTACWFIIVVLMISNLPASKCHVHKLSCGWLYYTLFKCNVPVVHFWQNTLIVRSKPWEINCKI